MFSKGQSQLVTAVLLTGIMIVLVSSVYIWGVPLIQKQKDTVTLDNMESFMKDLDNKIQKVASNGGRERIENINLPGDLRITDNDLNDTIRLDFTTTGQLISTGTDIYLVGDNNTLVSVNRPSGSIRVRSDEIDGDYSIEMELEYRKVSSASQCHKINLLVGGRTLVSSGRHDVTIAESGGERRADPECGDLFVTDVSVRFE